MINIVTLACNRDLRQVLLQSESIQKFVHPCDHWVVVNQRLTDSSKKRWHDILKPYHTKHRLRLWFPDDIKEYPDLYRYPTYSNYQVGFKYQFEIAQLLDDDYLVLTAKNFFIKPCNLEDFRSVLGSGRRLNIDDNPWLEFNKQTLNDPFCKFFDAEPILRLLQLETPALVKRDNVIKHLGDFKRFNEFWIDQIRNYKTDMKDWHFYSYMVREELESAQLGWPKLPGNQWSLNIWGGFYDAYVAEGGMKAVFKALEKEDPYVTAVHRHFIQNLSSAELAILNKWLQKKFGFKNKICRLRWYNHDRLQCLS